MQDQILTHFLSLSVFSVDDIIHYRSNKKREYEREGQKNEEQHR